MKQWILAWLVIGTGCVACADQLILANGQVVEGELKGFSKSQWLLTTPEGKEVREFSANLKRVVVDPAPTVAVEMVNRKHESVLFKGYEKFLLSLEGDGGPIRVSGAMLKGLTILSRPEPGAEVVEQDPPVVVEEGRAPEGAEKPRPVVEPPGRPIEQVARSVPVAAPMIQSAKRGTRDWKQEGKWREMQTPGLRILSQGEDIDVESQLKEGVVNVIHFHYAPAHSSVRQGNYVETLARNSRGRVVVQRIVVPDWNAPICTAKEIKALPQFWFYSRSGKLSSKLTERFTESDIDTALKKAQLQL